MKINIKTKSLRLGISKVENVTLGNKKINQGGGAASLTLSVLLVMIVDVMKMLKNRIAKAQGVFFTVKMAGKK